MQTGCSNLRAAGRRCQPQVPSGEGIRSSCSRRSHQPMPLRPRNRPGVTPPGTPHGHGAPPSCVALECPAPRAPAPRALGRRRSAARRRSRRRRGTATDPRRRGQQVTRRGDASSRARARRHGARPPRSDRATARNRVCAMPASPRHQVPVVVAPLACGRPRRWPPMRRSGHVPAVASSHDRSYSNAPAAPARNRSSPVAANSSSKRPADPARAVREAAHVMRVPDARGRP